MENNIHNNYLFRAIENYPWELEKAAEALNYALSYDPENVKALHLMAKLHCEQLGDNETAKRYFEKALESNMDFPDLYPDYIRLLINNDDYTKAQKLIDFAITVKGIDKAGINVTQAQLFEKLKAFDKAEEALKEAKLEGLNNDFISFVDDMISRVIKKRKMQNNKAKVEESETKKEEQVKTKTWFRDRLNNLL